MTRRLTFLIGLPGAVTAGLIAWTLNSQELYLFADILRLLVAVSVGCALVGTWLVLRRMAMMADAIGHSILLGIVVMFFFVSDPSSPLFVVGAALSGLLTVVLVQAFLATGRLKEDASIGMVFSFLFALALVIISVFFHDAHVDQHLVLAGGVEITVLRQVIIQHAEIPGWLARVGGGFIQSILPAENLSVTPDHRMFIEGLRLGPRALWTMGTIALVSGLFIFAFWKELKLSTFDAGLAASLGFAPTAIGYGLMSLVAVSAVGAFEAVGSILVIAMFVGPPATAYLLSRSLIEVMGLGLVIAAFNAWLGFVVGQALDVSFGGSVAAITGVVFLTAVLFAPNEGLVTQTVQRRRRKHEFAIDNLLVHLAHHEGTETELVETSLDALPQHLRWSPAHLRAIVTDAIHDGLIERTNGRIRLTPAGAQRAARALEVAGPQEEARLGSSVES
jgi:manganese/zinc/iron transport system permease protein